MSLGSRTHRLQFGLALALLLTPSLLVAGEPRHHDRQDLQYGFRARIGMTEPEGNSGFWDDAFAGFTGEVGGLEDPSIGAEFAYGVSDNIDITAGLGAFSGSLRSHYEDYTDGLGNEIRHRKTLDVTPLTVGFVAYPFGRDRAIRPFVGAGGGFYYWNYREAGDFIDFSSEDDDIVEAEYESDGTTVGYYFNAGVEARITRNAALFVEGRWHYGEDDPKEGDFENFGEIDLRAREVAVGMSWKF